MADPHPRGGETRGPCAEQPAALLGWTAATSPSASPRALLAVVNAGSASDGCVLCLIDPGPGKQAKTLSGHTATTVG
jgi:hypothetical protein